MISTLLLASLLTFPVLSMGISSVESHHNPLVKGRAGELTQFQIRPEIWGKPSKSIVGHYRQHDAILRELMEACGQDSMLATERYNGSGKKAKRYAEKVRQRALEMALLEGI